jgi:hypothetical protein
MDEIVTNADIRRQQAIKRVGGQSKQCVICPESYESCIEQHHIAARANHPETHPVCRNCHRKLSDAQRDHPAQVSSPPSLLEVVGHYLLGLADMLVLVAQSLIAFGKDLIAQARQTATGDAQ